MLENKEPGHKPNSKKLEAAIKQIAEDTAKLAERAGMPKTAQRILARGKLTDRNENPPKTE